MNIPDFFYDKELCDAIRDIAKNSATTIENAVIYMSCSTDYKRDSTVIKRMANIGMDKNSILKIIKELNISKFKMITYPDLRLKFTNETGKKLWNKDRSTSGDYLQWLEDYILDNQ